MSKKRDRHLLALESEEEEYKIYRERKELEEMEARGRGNYRFRPLISGKSTRYRLRERHNDGCVWPILRTFVLAPLLWALIIFLLKSCFGN